MKEDKVDSKIIKGIVVDYMSQIGINGGFFTTYFR